MSRQRKKRRPRQVGSSRDGHGGGKHDHGTNEDFLDELDHIAYHVAEALRDATDTWRTQGFSHADLETLPPSAKQHLRNEEDWKKLTGYIEKWLKKWLARDFQAPVIYGRVVVELVSNNNWLSIIFGYELQATESRN